MVQAGANASLNFGMSADLFAKNDPSTASARSVTYLKFNTGSIATSNIDQAILQVSGENVGSDSSVITHVYGLTNDNWNESTITWNNAPNLLPSTSTSLDDISENFIKEIGTTAHIEGHLTGIATSRLLQLDVTDFVHDHPDQLVTFLITREVRYDGENVDDALQALRMASKERGTAPGPQLLLSLSAGALPGDYDFSGTVDLADYTLWRQTVGTANTSADGNGNGIVDAADYAIWRSHLGDSMPGTAFGSSLPDGVPEPATVLLMLIGAVGCLTHRLRTRTTLLAV
jgi:hypothetical protein